MRIGYGYDVHKLVEDRPLLLGGVNIPFEKGLLGHSDADVVIHAVIDAILGAMAKGDIGKLFPDNDEAYKNIDSRQLLKKVYQTMEKEKYTIGNLDLSIVAAKPKLQPFIGKMRENIAADLNTATKNISIKATTEEGLGFSNLGISAKCVVLLRKI